MDRGPGIWRFNNSLLEDENFKCSIKQEIEKCIRRDSPYDDNVGMGVLMELLLSNCRGIAIRTGAEIKKQKRREEDELTKTLAELESKLNADVPESTLAYEEAKNRLEEVKSRKGEFAMLASGAKWMEQGEKPSKYFLNLCNKRRRQKAITCVKAPDGSIYYERKDVLAHCAEYYREMFREREIETENMELFSLVKNDPRLTEEEKMKCDFAITIEECIMALKGMARNKAPGITGFTAEFYICFWQQMAHLVDAYVREAFANKNFSLTMREG